jgi:peroxiredoxin
LLCDTTHEIGLSYGACESLQDRSAKRITYVIDPQGKIIQTYAKVNASSHPEEVLKSL